MEIKILRHYYLPCSELEPVQHVLLECQVYVQERNKALIAIFKKLNVTRLFDIHLNKKLQKDFIR